MLCVICYSYSARRVKRRCVSARSDPDLCAALLRRIDHRVVAPTVAQVPTRVNLLRRAGPYLIGTHILNSISSVFFLRVGVRKWVSV